MTRACLPDVFLVVYITTRSTDSTDSAPCHPYMILYIYDFMSNNSNGIIGGGIRQTVAEIIQDGWQNNFCYSEKRRIYMMHLVLYILKYFEQM